MLSVKLLLSERAIGIHYDCFFSDSIPRFVKYSKISPKKYGICFLFKNKHYIWITKLVNQICRLKYYLIIQDKTGFIHEILQHLTKFLISRTWVDSGELLNVGQFYPYLRIFVFKQILILNSLKSM